MPKFQVDASILSISVLAAAVGFTLLPGPFYWLGSIAGLSLALLLLAYDREGYRSVFESLGYGAVVSLCLTLAGGAVMRVVVTNQGQPPSFEGRIGSEWMPFLWLGVTILLWVIDRTRMSGRVQYGVAAPSQGSFGFAPAPLPAPVPAIVPPPLSAVTYAEPAAEPRATFTRPSFGTDLVEPAAPVVAERAPETPVAPAPFVAPPVSAPSAPPLAAPPPPAAFAPLPTPPVPAAPPVPVPSGKETTIYVTLVGEGLNVLRAVRAEHLGRDYYKITEAMPPGETWQFGPGQVVRCKKKNLSSGKAMVATEEAPRSR